MDGPDRPDPQKTDAPTDLEDRQTRLARWLTVAAIADPTPQRAEGRRLAAALRLVTERLLATAAPADELARAADDLEALAGRLAAYRHGGSYDSDPSQWVGAPPTDFLDFAPLLGRANPLAPPVTIEVSGDEVIGRARFSQAYEGPPGCVHGGFIAAAFDDVLGMVQAVSGQPSMTVQLTVRYLAPTPLDTELRFVGRLRRVDGRKILTHGDLFAGPPARVPPPAPAVTLRSARPRPRRCSSRWASNASRPWRRPARSAAPRVNVNRPAA